MHAMECMRFAVFSLDQFFPNGLLFFSNEPIDWIKIEVSSIEDLFKSIFDISLVRSLERIFFQK